jgi:hypothetical protein
MQKLKEAALTQPQGFYRVSDVGAPIILFGFLVGSLHNLYEEFGIERQPFDPCSKAEDELLDWWDVMYWLKRGLLDSARQSDAQGSPLRQMMVGLYGPEVDSIETAADYEFQWLLCRTYSNQTLTLNEALQLVKQGQDTQNVSNEYTGENLVHILIVKNHAAEYNLSWHLDILFDKFVTHPIFRMNLIKDKARPPFKSILRLFCDLSCNRWWGVSSALYMVAIRTWDRRLCTLLSR